MTSPVSASLALLPPRLIKREALPRPSSPGQDTPRAPWPRMRGGLLIWPAATVARAILPLLSRPRLHEGAHPPQHMHTILGSMRLPPPTSRSAHGSRTTRQAENVTRHRHLRQLPSATHYDKTPARPVELKTPCPRRTVPHAQHGWSAPAPRSATKRALAPRNAKCAHYRPLRAPHASQRIRTPPLRCGGLTVQRPGASRAQALSIHVHRIPRPTSILLPTGSSSPSAPSAPRRAGAIRRA
ncbi:hypothetical protein C8J57DRAFT_1368995 [Mycena rebaudengoi]|nr:hypothetical protein C8J57DRAFT_1368995 [Mycena rebaudengoi]